MIDLAHFAQRLLDPFNTESRFYWPLVLGVFLAMVVHTAWYLWRPTKPRQPVRDQVEAVVYWVDLVGLILVLVLISAKVPAWVIGGMFAIDWVAILFVYFVYAPPRHREWAREERKRRYIPEAKRRAARR